MRGRFCLLCCYFQISQLRPGAYGLDDSAVIGVHPEPGTGGNTAVASIKGYSPPVLEPSLIGQKRDIALGISPAIPHIINGVPGSVRNIDSSPLRKGESNILFVDGLPTDCTRREVSRILLPCICSFANMCVLCV